MESKLKISSPTNSQMEKKSIVSILLPMYLKHQAAEI
jgi:hypothetical protein